MRIIYVEPEKEPRLMDIPHTLSDMQALVGGRIEVVEPFTDDVVLICDEEGRNNGKPICRIINDSMDICGSFFLCGENNGDLCSIPEPLIFKYVSLFRIGNPVTA